MRIEVAYAGPEGEALEALDLPEGATVADALGRATLVPRLGLELRLLAPGIFGQRAHPATPLRDGDRIDLTRALVADPKDARRRRAAENPLPRPRPTPRRRQTLR